MAGTVVSRRARKVPAQPAKKCHAKDRAPWPRNVFVSGLVVKRLDSLSDLRRAAGAWDDLWQRSEITLPTARAEMIALWSECFAADRPFVALTVVHDGQLVGALPLIETRLLGLKVGGLPGNDWSPAGDLLVDQRSDVNRVCQRLLEALRHAAWPMLWLDALPGKANRWQMFLQTLEHERVAHARQQRFAIDLVEIQENWAEYFSARSRNHRRHVHRAAARARKRGLTELSRYDQLTPEQVEPLLRACFELEASGWKGRARSAVLHVPGAWDFYLRQARQLAAWRQLSVNVLQHQGQPIAFEYGWRSKGVYCTPKVGYDEAFGPLAPGQLLRYRLIEQLHRERDVGWIDFLGPASPATSKWATDRYAIDRVVVALHGALGRAVVAAYRRYWPLAQKMRRCEFQVGDRPQPPCTLDLPDRTEPARAPAVTP
jgi:CelD/BcsL family acetyltransferase involved in cellulose biosynthesis